MLKTADIEIAQLYLSFSSIWIFNFLFPWLLNRQIKKNHLKGWKILVNTCVFRVKAGTPLQVKCHSYERSYKGKQKQTICAWIHAPSSLWPRRLNLKLTSPSCVQFLMCLFQWKLIPRLSSVVVRQDYNANKIQPDGKYRKQRSWSKINYIVPLDRDSRMQTLQSPGVVLPSIQGGWICLAHNVRVSVSR